MPPLPDRIGTVMGYIERLVPVLHGSEGSFSVSAAAAEAGAAAEAKAAAEAVAAAGAAPVPAAAAQPLAWARPFV